MPPAENGPVEDPLHLRCLKCGSDWLVRSRRRWWERVFPYLSYWRPYRCRGCGMRGWHRIIEDHGSGNDETSGAASLLFR